MKTICRYIIIALVLTRSSSAILNISITAPSTESTTLALSIDGSFVPSQDITGPVDLIWTDIGDLFASNLQDDFLLSSAISIEGSSGTSGYFEAINLDFDGGLDNDDFALRLSSDTLYEGLAYSVNGSATFDISSASATFENISQGTYTLPNQPSLGSGHILHISTAPVPEPTSAIFLALGAAAVVAWRRAFPKSREQSPA
ncbi:MAG: PEP-CTERM sorting domain-containing protein [Opitutales bacterium]